MLQPVPSNIMVIISLAAAAAAIEPKHLMRRRWWRASGRCQLARCGEAERALTCAPSERCGWNAGWAGAEGPAASSPPLPPLPPLWVEFSAGRRRKQTDELLLQLRGKLTGSIDWLTSLRAHSLFCSTYLPSVKQGVGGGGGRTQISCGQETTSSSKVVATCWPSHSHSCSFSSVERWRSVLGGTLHEPLTHPLSWQTRWTFTVVMTHLFLASPDGFYLVYSHYLSEMPFDLGGQRNFHLIKYIPASM